MFQQAFSLKPKFQNSDLYTKQDWLGSKHAVKKKTAFSSKDHKKLIRSFQVWTMTYFQAYSRMGYNFHQKKLPKAMYVTGSQYAGYWTQMEGLM